MKKLIIVAALLIAAVWSQTRMTNMGSLGWYRMVYFGADSSTKIVFVADSVQRDSSGTLVRIDNGADSCSLPVSLFQGKLTEPIWKYEMDLLVKADSVDSSAISYRIETRKQKSYSDSYTTGTYWGKWIPFKRVRRDSNTVISDSVLTWPTVPAKGTWGEESHLFFTTGHQARFCPIELDTTIVGDSIWHDSIYIYMK